MINNIKKTVLKEFDSHNQDVFIWSRKRPLVLLRQTILALSWVSGAGSHSKLARVSGRNHSTISHSIKVVREMYQFNKEYQCKFMNICESLGIDPDDILMTAKIYEVK